MPTITQLELDGVTYDIGSSETIYGGLEMLNVNLPANGWSSNAQTVTVSSNASNTSDYLVIPQLATAGDYTNAGIILANATPDTTNHTVTLRFTCTNAPSSAVSAIVLVTNSALSTVGTLTGVLSTSVSLPSSSWTLSSGLYTQSASVTWMANSDVPFCQADITTSAQADAWAAICKAESLAGSIKFYALEQPGANLTVQIAVVR